MSTSRVRLWNRWTKALLLLIVFLWAVSETISLAVQHTALRKSLSARLEAAFGRPVEVRSYEFSFWGGPSIQAHSVTVAEDPRFGHEYFLRVDSMAVRLRWQSLLRGRLEFGTLSLSRPSLNLVRDAAGDWNLAEWLPRPSGNSAAASSGSAVGPAAASSAPRFRRIEVADGRINFKRATEKLPFAFVGVSGAVEMNAAGSWSINIEATPWRSAIVIQRPGAIYVSGVVGGTSSRLHPAALDLSWSGASVSDVLRLTHGDDYGVRGTLAFVLHASTHERDEGWSLTGRAQLRQLHQWNLPSRPDNPSINLISRSDWSPADPGLDLSEISLEAPHSNARIAARILWNTPVRPKEKDLSPLQASVLSSRIDAGDLLAWVRAFHPGVSDDLSARGLASVSVAFSGWPLTFVNGSVSSDGIQLSAPNLRVPAHLGRIQFGYSHGAVSSAPVTLTFAAPRVAPSGSFQMSVSTNPRRSTLPDWHLAGNATQMRDLVATAGALGWNLSRGWDIAGPLSCDLLWHSARVPWQTRPDGWIVFGASGGQGAALHAPFLNQPVDQIQARAELKEGVSHVALSSAEAFGTRWTGTFDRSPRDSEWQFALAAPRLEAADLDRWLNPRWRESFLDRMLPFLNSQPPAPAVPEDLRAAGHISLDQLVLAPLTARRVQGDLDVAGRRVEFSNASGQLYMGTVRGDFTANLEPVPSYDALLEFSRVDLSSLTGAAPQLAGLFDGAASGEISFRSSGATAADLADSLECQGTADITEAQLSTLNLLESLRVAAMRPGKSVFRQASSTFSCAAGSVHFQDLALFTPDGRIDMTGTVDFKRNVDLNISVLPSGSGLEASDSNAAQSAYRLTGTLVEPAIARVHPSRRGR